MQFNSLPLEGYVPVENARLFCREVGQGQPIVLLHGGPSFDHSYLLPDMDRLADTYRLIYYDQRGRGKSGDNVRPEDVTIQSEVEDLERLRGYFGLESVALLGHSWGGTLAMEYATHYPERVSHLMLINTAPASYDGWMLFQREFSNIRAPGELDKMKELGSSARYQEGDHETDAEYFRIYFRPTVRQPEQLERVVKSLRSNVTQEGIVKSREIGDRLFDDTYRLSGYSLLPKLQQLSIPTLIIHGDYDFIPIECVAPIGKAIAGARFVVLRDCGHFSYIECPDEVRQKIADFFHNA
jgi:proline iminopeptidase